MAAPMAPHYVNLFVENFEQNLLQNYYQKTRLSPMYDFILLTTFSTYGLVIKGHRIISLLSLKITVNLRT